MDILTMLALIRSGQYAGGSVTSNPYVDDVTGRSTTTPPFAGPMPAPSQTSTSTTRRDPYDLVGEDERKRALYAGLSQAGIGLLSTAGTGDYTGGLARAFQGFNQGRSGALAESQARGRQLEQDERQRRQDALQEELARSTEERQKGIYAHQQSEWADESAKEVRQLTAARSMVRVIEDEAGEDSPEARRARALADLGEDADIGRLAALHAEVTARKRFPEDTRQKTQLEIEEAKAKIAAGVAADPAAAERRAEEGMKLERWRTSLYGTQVSKQLDRDPKPPTPQQLNDDVAAEAQRIYQQKLDALKLAYGDGKPRMTKDASGQWKLEPAKPFNANDLERIRREANQEALATVRSRYGASAATGRGVPPGVYRFDAQGNLLSQ